jgi:hypothetical protein
VILYIDDLDRCPVDRVVMVLEAVHLLLALKLFVVVVGVDPRWLMRSLRQHYAAQLAPSGTPLSSWEGDRAYWNSTPENYLEKIFQVPFSLRPMSQPGYVKLMTSVLGQPQEPGDGMPAMSSPGGVGSQRDGPAASDVVAASPPPDALAAEYQPPPPEGPEAWSEEPAVALPGDLAVDETSESPVLNAGDVIEIDQATVGDEPPTNEVTLKPEPVTFEAAPAELKITKAEFDFIAGLRDFIDTPRSAKRLANTYRLIKVLPTPPDAPIDDDPDAEHKIPLVLLAIVIGYPRPAGDVFRELLEATDKTWPAFRKRVIDARVPPQTRPNAARGAQPRNGSRTVAATTRSAASAARDGRDAPPPAEPEQTIDWERLAAALKDLEAGGALPAPLGPYRSWARLVGRFSFEIGRVTTVETEDDDRGKSPSPPAGSPKESPSF